MSVRDRTAVALYVLGAASVSTAAFLEEMVLGFAVLGGLLILAALLLGRS